MWQKANRETLGTVNDLGLTSSDFCQELLLLTDRAATLEDNFALACSDTCCLIQVKGTQGCDEDDQRMLKFCRTEASGDNDSEGTVNLKKGCQISRTSRAVCGETRMSHIEPRTAD